MSQERPGLHKAIHVLHTGAARPLLDRGVDAAFTPHRLSPGAPASSIPDEVAVRISAIAAGGGASPVGVALMDRLPQLKIISSFGVGYEHIDAQEAARRGIVVTHTPDVLTDEVADLTLGLLLATIRRLAHADRFVRDGLWTKGAFPLTASLRGRRVGILGLGRIGKAIARRLEGFGVEIAYCGRSRQSEIAYPYFSSVAAMAAAVDTLIVAAPGGAATARLVDANVLSALGANGVLINIGRGNIVDESALVAALSNGTIMAAGLDVFETEPHIPAALIALDNVVLLPHVGSASSHTRDAMARLVIDNLLSWFAGRGPLTPVPETPWAGAARSDSFATNRG